MESAVLTASLLTPSQTIGPFFSHGLSWMEHPHAQALRIDGQVFDGQGTPVVDALLEAWQPSAIGESQQAIAQLQRTATDAEGRFCLQLAAPVGNAPAAFITLFARGLLRHLTTAIWLPGQTAHPLLEAVLPAARRQSLVAQAGAQGLVWNVCLQESSQGQETVFFDYRSL